MSRPLKNALSDFCISVLLKYLKIIILYPTKSIWSQVQESAKEFSHGLGFSMTVRFVVIFGFATKVVTFKYEYLQPKSTVVSLTHK